MQRFRAWFGLGVVGVVLATAGWANGQYFKVSSGDWTNAASWDNGVVPTAASNTRIGSGAPGMSVCTAYLHAADSAVSATLRIGDQAAGQYGTLNIEGGLLAVGGVIYMAHLAGNTGFVVQSSGVLSNGTDIYIGEYGRGSWTMTGGTITNTGQLRIGEYTGANGEMRVSGESFVRTTQLVLSRNAGSRGTLIQEGGTILHTGAGYVGYLAYGRLVASNGVMNGSGQSFQVGYSAGGTGDCLIVDGVLTNYGTVYLGNSGDGTIRIEGTGSLYSAGMRFGEATGGRGLFVQNGGYARINGEIRAPNGGMRADCVISNGVFDFSPNTFLGAYAASGTNVLRIAGGTMRGGSLYADYVGTGSVTLAGGLLELNQSASALVVGGGTTGAGAQTGGVMSITGGTLLLSQSGAGVHVGYYRQGTLTMTGGAVTNVGSLFVGRQPNSRGEMLVSGGTWWQSNTANIGYSTATYGELKVSNGVFDAQGSVDMGPNNTATGRVELCGTQRVFRVGAGGTLRLGYGGGVTSDASITNHVRKIAGGVDLRNPASGALVFYAGRGRIHLAFEQDPAETGDFWGLRWAGTNHIAALQACTNTSPKQLTWDDSALSPIYQGKVTIYTNATDTMVGFYVSQVSVNHGSMFLIR